MKIGVRKPSIKRSIKARITGKLKRAAKKAVNPLYGKKGMGMLKNPKKAVYNKVYNKTTIGISNVTKAVSKKKKLDNINDNNEEKITSNNRCQSIKYKVNYCGNCGAKIDENDKFCGGCGYKI